MFASSVNNCIAKFRLFIDDRGKTTPCLTMKTLEISAVIRLEKNMELCLKITDFDESLDIWACE